MNISRRLPGKKDYQAFYYYSDFKGLLLFPSVYYANGNMVEIGFVNIFLKKESHVCLDLTVVGALYGAVCPLA